MSETSFVALDVETANPDSTSICQLGIAAVSDGTVVDEWKTYVNPGVPFQRHHTGVHGITEDMVQGQPAFPAAYEALHARLNGRLIVSHTIFDRTAIRRAIHKHELPALEGRWLDTAALAARACPELCVGGVGLDAICAQLGYTFRRHDALEDAKAAAYVLGQVIARTETPLREWARRYAIRFSSSPRAPTADATERLPALAGHVIVFTGTLVFPRADATVLAESCGATVGPNVTKRTSLLVVGDQDVSRLAGHEKSGKHRKAEELIEGGQAIRILTESDFLDLSVGE